MLAFLRKLREKSGELWWYSALIFLSCRAGDAIQAFTGLWLVPKYVGTEELGAAQPLISSSSLFALPLYILAIPFSRFLALYSSRGQFGKVKRLLSIGLGATLLVFFATLALSRFFFPFFFERLGIEEGSLGFLIVSAGLCGCVADVFTNALRGLKKFNTMALVNILGAPLRLVVMLVFMPFRALSGYMMGQASGPVLTIATAAIALRKHIFTSSVKSEKIGRADIAAMIRYTIPIALFTATSFFSGTWQGVLFRQRLPVAESAAFYMISRFADIAHWAGITLSAVVLPLIVEKREKGDSVAERSLLLRSMFGALVPGLIVAVVFIFLSHFIFNLVPLWREHLPYAHLLPLWTLRMAFYGAIMAFTTCKIAAGDFKFLYIWLPLLIADPLSLAILDSFTSFQVANLAFFISFVTCTTGVFFSLALLFVCRHGSNKTIQNNI